MDSDGPRASTVSQESSDKGVDMATCRVCHCIESDRKGDIVLGFLGISPPVEEPLRDRERKILNDKKASINYQENLSIEDEKLESGYLEFISPEGEIFICRTDIETGDCTHQDALIELGCSCKNDLTLVHYACALKWFVSHGSTVCEICGYVATNIRSADFKKVIASLREYDELRERTASGVPNPAVVHCSSGVVDPDALAAIRRQRLSEISLWFNPHHSNLHQNNNAPTASHVVREQAPGTVAGEAASAENQAAKWAVEGTGILLATGLLTVSLAWLIAPRVGKVVLTRIKYGPARYWVILFVFWFLVFGIWASRTHSVHTT